MLAEFGVGHVLGGAGGDIDELRPLRRRGCSPRRAASNDVTRSRPSDCHTSVASAGSLIGQHRRPWPAPQTPRRPGRTLGVRQLGSSPRTGRRPFRAATRQASRSATGSPVEAARGAGTCRRPTRPRQPRRPPPRARSAISDPTTTRRRPLVASLSVAPELHDDERDGPGDRNDCRSEEQPAHRHLQCRDPLPVEADQRRTDPSQGRRSLTWITVVVGQAVSAVSVHPPDTPPRRARPRGDQVPGTEDDGPVGVSQG